MSISCATALANTAIDRLDAELLLAHVLSKSRAQLWANRELLLSETNWQQFQKLILRRQAGEPLAYLLGEKEFWSLALHVNQDTLVPRPETELLVQIALAMADAAKPLVCADLGTGSGAIALALAHECPHWQIFASDMSEGALSVAKKNQQRHQIKNVAFFAASWCHALREQAFDVIVSNPPYIAADDTHLLALRFEPQTALVADKQGMADLTAIALQAPRVLRKSGHLILEHGYQQADSLRQQLAELGYGYIMTHNDMAGLPRVTSARYQ